jgi:uncharacterized protein YxeA
MKRILIGLLLVILATSYIVQQQHIIEKIEVQLESQSLQEQVVEKEITKAKKPRQNINSEAYPPPPDEPLLPYPAPDNSPTRTPLPTPTRRPTPTYAPTMNPLDD